jgi:ketosteroid isomerase-like protein
MSEQHVATVQAVYEAFGRGDVPAILAQLSDDVRWDHDTPSWGLPWYEPRTGPAEVAEFFRALGDNIILHRLEPANFLTGGNQVAVLLEVELEVKGGTEVRPEQEIHLWTFDDTGRINGFSHVIDRHWQVSQYRGVRP